MGEFLGVQAIDGWFRAHAAGLLGTPASDAVDGLNRAGFWVTVVQVPSPPASTARSEIELLVSADGVVRAVQLV